MLERTKTMALINFFSAFILSLIITPAAIKLCILDKPNYRKIHDKPIPKGGGIGIFLPTIFLELITVVFFYDYVSLDIFKYLTITFVTLILMAEGIIDDKIELGSKVKLCIQIIVALLTLCSGIRFHTFDIKLLDLTLSAIWIIGIINAINLIDGLDGLAAGIAVIACTGFSIIGFLCGDKTITILSLIIIGGCFGFLKYNFRPARIFMGDTGSIPLGYNLAVIGILCENITRGKVSLLIPVIMLGIPVYDTLLSIIRRAVNHKPIFQPDRSHFYNLIIDLKGIGHMNTVLIIYAINIIMAAISIILAFTLDIWRIIFFFALSFVAYLLSIKLGFVRGD